MSMELQIQSFLDTLIHKGYYHTLDPSHLSRWDRFLGRYDTWYYLNLFRIFLSARIAVSQQRFDCKLWQQKAYEILRLVEKCGGKIEIDNYEYVSGVKQPVVYVANHMSALETLILPFLLMTHHHGVTVIVKENLLRYPVLGPVVKHIQPIVAGRKNARAEYPAIISAGTSSLRSGNAVLVFPEATRRAEFHPAHFNTIGVKLALHANTLLIPVAVKTDFHGLGKILKDIGPVRRSQTVRFKFGSPISVEGNGRSAHAMSVNFISKTLREWGVPVRE